MVSISTNRLKDAYERAARALEEAQAAYDALVTEHAPLFQYLDETTEVYNEVESRLATQEEFDEATEAWQNASDAVDFVSGNAWNVLAGAKERAYAAYSDYIA